jgi:hypothetical protein
MSEEKLSYIVFGGGGRGGPVRGDGRALHFSMFQGTVSPPNMFFSKMADKPFMYGKINTWAMTMA